MYLVWPFDICCHLMKNVDLDKIRRLLVTAHIITAPFTLEITYFCHLRNSSFFILSFPLAKGLVVPHLPSVLCVKV